MRIVRYCQGVHEWKLYAVNIKYVRWFLRYAARYLVMEIYNDQQ